MSMQRIGECSLCGGIVMAWRGGWLSVGPPPPPTCQTCGAIEESSTRVIKMTRPGTKPNQDLWD